MRKINKVLVGAVAALSPVTVALSGGGVAYADSKEDVCAGIKATGGSCNSSSDLTTKTIPTVIKTMLFFVGILAVIMIIFSGIRYITAHGDKAQIQGATQTLIYSIVGLVVAILAYAIVSFVTSIF